MASSDIIKKTGLSPEDIVSIIKELKDSRITSLEFRGLKLSMQPEAPVIGGWTSVPAAQVKFDPTQPVAFSSITATTADEAIDLNEDDHLDMIKLEDPEAYERLIEKRELEDAESTED